VSGPVLHDLSASADVRGGRIDVAWLWSGLGERPGFRLVRRRRAYPDGPEDGYAVLELGELFRASDEPWVRISRIRYLTRGSVTEGGLVEAALAFFHGAAGSGEPEIVELAWHDAAAGGLAVQRIDEVSRLERTLPDPGPWALVEAVEIFHAPGGGSEASAGVVTVFHGHEDPAGASRFRWEPAGGVAIEAEFDDAEVIQTAPRVSTLTDQQVTRVWQRFLRRDGWDVATALQPPESAADAALEEDGALTLREDFSEDTGEWTRSILVSDLSPATEEASYYALFRPDPGDPGRWSTERGWRAHATATARYGFPDRLYGLLPSVHRYYDEPNLEDRDRGQLRRFLQVPGIALDHLRSGAESLRTRHDLAEVRGDLLPALGAWIAWPTDRTAPLPIQRGEIRMAPAVYGSVGTLPNIVALATRITGWKCQVKEFVHNLFLTNAPESVPIRELWSIAHDPVTGFGAPVRVATTPLFDGRPAVVGDGAGRTWLFWHSNRSGRFELWLRVLEGDDGTEPRPLAEPLDDEPAPGYADLSPAAIRRTGPGGDALWLFWESDREGAWDVWGRVHDGTHWATPFRVTDHREPDRRPGVALGAGGTLWVFWESGRRGPTEIWGRSHSDGGWSHTARVTESPGHDREPAAALDEDDRLWLVWRRDHADHSRLYARVLDDGAWGPEAPVEPPSVGEAPWRDESPALARRGSELWLLWHSDRTGRWELWASVHDGVAWSEPFQITQKADPDKEPAVMLDGDQLRIVWRSERPTPEYRSRTVDTTDTALLERRGLFEDRIHYTYDTARGDRNWYARDVVGLFLTPPPGTSTEEVEDVLERARTSLEPFSPATVRLVLVPDRPLESVDFSSDGIHVDHPIVDTFEDEIE
jgi:hypothetical protein